MQDYQVPDSQVQRQPDIPRAMAPSSPATPKVNRVSPSIGYLAAGILALATLGVAWALWSLWPLVMVVGRTPR